MVMIDVRFQFKKIVKLENLQQVWQQTEAWIPIDANKKNNGQK